MAHELLFIRILLVVGSILVPLAVVRFRKGLRNLPGPFWASILPIYRLNKQWKRQAHQEDIDQHRRYGEIVRVGPKHVSISSCEDVATVYSINGKFQKSDYYITMDVKTPSGLRQTMVSSRDDVHHRTLKRPIANAFSMTTMVELEPQVDKCIRILEDKFDARLDQDIDLGDWMQFFAFDVITTITFSDRMGFLDEGRDVNGVLDALETRFRYGSFVGQYPPLHSLLLGNRIGSYLVSFLPSIANAANNQSMVAFAGRQLERYKSQDTAHKEYKDLLDRFKKSKDGVQVMTDTDLLIHATTNISAGADTTGSALKAAFWYLYQNPAARKRLVAEIDAYHAKGAMSDPITYAESLEMPYWQACLKETLRMHPAGGIMLERVVPEGGVTLSGTFLPAGTIVGANPWTLAREMSVFGEDADAFRPERWLDSGPEQLRRMERHSLIWGGGSRTCIGKNIALLEVNKLVPQLLRRYEVDIVHPERYRVESMLVAKQFGLFCQLSRRKTGVVEA